MKKLIVCLLFGLFGFSAVVNAAGIGVTPNALEINQITTVTTESTLRIYNTGETAAIFELEVDDYSQSIKIKSNKFRLEADQSRQVSLIFSQLPPGNYQSSLSVIAEDVSQDLQRPKSGLKIPIKFNIAGVNNNSLFLIALAVLVLVLLLLIIIALRRRILILMTVLAVLIAGGLLAWSFFSQPLKQFCGQDCAGQDYISANITVFLETPDNLASYQLAADNLSAFRALQKVAEDYTIPLSYDPPSQMGIFVTAIAGWQNGTDDKYWVYEVNDQMIPVAADKYFLNPNDKLVWKFVKPNL